MNDGQYAITYAVLAILLAGVMCFGFAIGLVLAG